LDVACFFIKYFKNIMEINKLISDRWSPVAFSPEIIEKEKIEKLFEAARWAPSSYNAQPWRFIYGQIGDASYSILFDIINETNRKWAKTAPLMVLGIAQTVFPERKTENRFAFYDTGMAVGNMLLQATSMGLFVHQMGGYDVLAAKEVFNLPAGYEPVAMMAIGYKGDAGQLPGDISDREKSPRKRRQLEEFVFQGKF
jgi:nitroreductase